MKKIMIYTKHNALNNKNLIDALKVNSSVIVLYISMLCGNITGCLLLKNILNTGKTFVNPNCIGTSGENYYILLPVFIMFFALILSFCGGLSCFGIIIQIFILFFCGAASGILSTILLSEYGNKGLLQFFVSNLPGLLLIISAMIIFGNITNKISNNITYNLFNSRNERIDLRTYLTDFLICTAVCFTGLLINIFLYKFLN